MESCQNSVDEVLKSRRKATFRGVRRVTTINGSMDDC